METIFTNKQSSHCCSNSTNSKKSFRLIFHTSFLLLIAFIFSSNLAAQVPVIDGNPSEWPAILNNAANTKKAFKHDPFNINHIDDSWTGGSQDGDASPSANWTWVYGNSNDKGDIGNAGAVLIGTRLYFFGDRSSFSGDAQIGFWFFLNNVQPTGDGANPGSPFTGEHANGDLLIISNFTNGGGNAVPTIYRWTGKTANTPGAPVIVTNATAALTTNGSQYNVPGGTNGTLMFNGETWLFSPKSGTEGTYPPPLFFEGYVDLATISGSSPCFQRFLLETRNSQSIGASLQDLVAGNFSGIPQPPTVQGDEKCVNNQPLVLTASCTHTSGTPTWYANATTTTPLGAADGVSADGTTLTKTGLPVGTTTYYVTCKDGPCESSRVPVSAIVNPLPAVDGVVTEGENNNSIDDGITKIADDLYQIRISKTTTANLAATASGGSGSYTSYVWQALNANAAISFVPNSANAVFTVLSTQGLNTVTGYSFKVTLTDSKGCIAYDTVTIVPVGTAIPCEVNGPAIVCAGSTSNVYTYLDGTSTLDPDFNYTWSISGNGTINGAPQVNVNSVTVTAGAGAGSYTVTMTITGKANSLQDPPPCSKTASVKLVSLSLGKEDVSCYGGSDGTVTATFSGGTAPYKIQIDGGSYVNPATSPHTFTGLAQGSHTVHVVDFYNCEASSSITVNQPPLLSCSMTAPATAAGCGSSGNTVSGTISGGTAPYSCSASFDAAATNAGWAVTNCAVNGTGITVTYTAGANGPAVLTVSVTDAKGCTSTCSVNLTCTGGHGCTPGFWKSPNGLAYWDQAGDPVAQAAGFTTNTSFFGFLDIQTYCGLSSTLTMKQAIELGGGGCQALARHGVAALLNAATLPDYPLPAGVTTYQGLKDAIEAAFETGCNCGPLATELAASNELDHSNCGQVLTQSISSLIARIEEAPTTSTDLKVDAYPNPYNSVVNFRFSSPATGKAMLEVYDILGRRLGVVYQGKVDANVPVNVKYYVPALSRVSLIYKLTVDDKTVRGNVIPDKN